MIYRVIPCVQPKKRIGCGELGVQEIKDHPFFAEYSWEAVYRKQVPIPFVPTVEDESDVFNIDKEFLNEAPSETPIEANPLLAKHNT